MKEESTFIDWQRAKVQETTDEVSPETYLRIYYLGHSQRDIARVQL